MSRDLGRRGKRVVHGGEGHAGLCIEYRGNRVIHGVIATEQEDEYVVCL